MRTITAAALLALLPLSAQAYVGPGAGLGAFAVTIAVLLGLVLLVIGFLWYPIKRMLKGRRHSRSGSAEDSGERD